MRLEGTPNRDVLPVETKACAEALQSVQRRTRIAFFLSLAISCIVVIMVLNLWESRQFRNTKLMLNTPEKMEYAKAYSQHVADNSFYRVTALGIQITCEDVGILGPLALLVFSLYSAIAFEACYRHVRRAANELFENSLLIRILLETELPLAKPEQSLEQPLNRFEKYLENWMPRLFLFLPFAACVAVILYDIFAHWIPPLAGDPLAELINQNRSMVVILDVIGIVFTLVVLYCNWLTFQLSRETKKVVEQRSAPKTPTALKATAASATHRT
jgi:hypothetical protein